MSCFEEGFDVDFLLGFRKRFIFFLNCFTRFSPIGPMYGSSKYTYFSSFVRLVVLLSLLLVFEAFTNLSISLLLTIRGNPFQEANFLISRMPSLNNSLSQILLVRYTNDLIREMR